MQIVNISFGLSLTILTQFLKCALRRTIAKKCTRSMKTLFWGSRSFERTDVGACRKHDTGNQQIKSAYLHSAAVLRYRANSGQITTFAVFIKLFDALARKDIFTHQREILSRKTIFCGSASARKWRS